MVEIDKFTLKFNHFGVCDDIDECEEDPCHENAYCSNSFGSYSCSCKPGYTGSEIRCTDVDECSSVKPKCHERAKCINLDGSFKCSCITGYTGNGISWCVDTDECSKSYHSCHTHATCENIEASYNCHCKKNFVGNGRSDCNCVEGLFLNNSSTCEDIDECEGEPCDDENASCLNNFGSYECSCNPGYYGTGKSCDELDECSTKLHSCHEQAEIGKETIGSKQVIQFHCFCFEK